MKKCLLLGIILASTRMVAIADIYQEPPSDSEALPTTDSSEIQPIADVETVRDIGLSIDFKAKSFEDRQETLEQWLNQDVATKLNNAIRDAEADVAETNAVGWYVTHCGFESESSLILSDYTVFILGDGLLSQLKPVIGDAVFSSFINILTSNALWNDFLSSQAGSNIPPRVSLDEIVHKLQHIGFTRPELTESFWYRGIDLYDEDFE